MNLSRALLLWIVTQTSGLIAQDAEPPTDFIRYQDERGSGGIESLQTAIVRYVHPEHSTTIDLVSVVHVGDTIYYQQLGVDLAVYQAVYYEMVGGEDRTAPPRQGRQSRSVARSALDRAIRFLGLSYQVDWIDYRAANFIHADVSWRELYDLMEARNESLQSLFEKSASGSSAGFRSAAAGSLTGGDRRVAKRAMAREFGEAEALMEQIESSGGTSLVADRNAHVMSQIRLDSNATTVPRQIAIFYGAGHMRDFERRLSTLGFVRDSVIWRDAWRIGP